VQWWQGNARRFAQRFPIAVGPSSPVRRSLVNAAVRLGTSLGAARTGDPLISGAARSLRASMRTTPPKSGEIRLPIRSHVNPVRTTRRLSIGGI